MMRLRISSLARLDLDIVYDRIAADKPGAARGWLNRTMEQFTRLARNPQIGEARDEIRPSLRSISHGNYVIYFRSREAEVEIVRILHGARDVQDLL
jgi:toxin ParE1/3/4